MSHYRSGAMRQFLQNATQLQLFKQVPSLGLTLPMEKQASAAALYPQVPVRLQAGRGIQTPGEGRGLGAESFPGHLLTDTFREPLRSEGLSWLGTHVPSLLFR